MTTTSAASPVATSPPASRVLRILVVEDTRVDAELAIAVLKRAGYSLAYDIVDRPGDLKACLKRASYDLVLADHNLVDWTGMEALALVRELAPSTPFIVSTAVLGDESAVEYIKNGAADYVLKHRLQERLPAVVGHALREYGLRKQQEQMQEQILEGKRQWELTFDAVPDAVLLIDGEYRIRRANFAAAKLLDLPFSDLIERQCFDVVHGACGPIEECPHAKLLATGLAHQEEILESRLNRTLQISVSPVRDSQGVLQGSVHVMRDVTLRRREETMLRRQALVFNNMYSAVMVVEDQTHLITDWNPAAERLFGYSRDEAVGKGINLIGPSPDSDIPHRIVAGLEQFGRWEGELPFVTKDGKSGVSQTIVVPMLDERGHRIGRIGMCRDITERKRAEQLQSAMYTISEQAVLAETVAELLKTVHSAIRELIGVTNFYFAALDERTNTLTFPYFADECDVAPASETAKGLAEYVLRTGVPILVTPAIQEELVERGEFAPGGTPPVDWLGVPLRLHERIFGVLAVQSYSEKARLTDRHKEMLHFIAQQVAGAIARKRTEELTREQLSELQRWRDVSLDREDRIFELKREVNQLLKQSGAAIRYPSSEESAE